MEGRLEGRRILVTGASGGIGAATARAVAAAGGQVALLARREDRIAALAEELGGAAVPADVVDVAAVGHAVARAAEALGGRLDGLVNAAGVLRPGTVAEGDPDDWALTFDVNVRGLLHATQAAIPYLTAADHADVVNVSSMSGRRLGSAPMGVYAASKAAVHMLSEGLRRELGERGVRVAVIAPGIVETDIFAASDHETAHSLAARSRQIGLSADQVADRIVEVLATPPGVVHAEVAMLSIDQ